MPFKLSKSTKRRLAVPITVLTICVLGHVATAQDSPPNQAGASDAPSVEVLTQAIQFPPGQRSAQPRIQGDLPPELTQRPANDQATLQKANRFIPTAIDPELTLKLLAGRPKILQLTQTPKRIYTPTDTIIQTEIIDQASGREVAVTGLQPGTTTLIFWFDDETAPGGQTTIAYEVQVFDDPLLARPTGDLEADLNEKFPNSYIELDEIAGRLIVRGQVPDLEEMSQILSVLSGARGVQPNVQAQQATQRATTVTTITAFPDDQLLNEDEAASRRRDINELELLQAGIINQLKVVGEQQVMLKVTVAEVNRGAARSIGLNFSADGGNFRTLTGNIFGIGGGGGGGGGAFGTANILANLDMGQVSAQIEALRTMNLSRTLAEPNLVAMNGQPANFQAGGQFPIPVLSSGGAGGNNLQGVTFVPFGVQLQFTPFIQDRDVIRLQMSAEVSSREESLGANTGGGGQVAGLDSRNFSTTVQLRSGQTIAVAGLLQTNFGASTDRIPFWGDLPIIGATGGRNRSSSGEQELVILVTPHLVAAIDGREGPMLPGSDVHEPTDIEFYVANRLESRRSRDYRTSVRTDYVRQKHAEQCLPENFMIGQVGPTDRCRVNPNAVPHAAVPAAGIAGQNQSTNQPRNPAEPIFHISDMGGQE
jgi:pilus assembly protein CpaC